MKALLIGAGVALTAGFMMGAAMKPDLLADQRPEGPQIFTTWAGESTGPFDPGASFVAYRGKVPDYVLGTDLTQPKLPAVVTEAPPEPQEIADLEPIPQADDVTYEAPAPQTPQSNNPVVIYPSMGGGVVAAPTAEFGQAG